MLVLIHLADHGETRSAALKRAVCGISQEMVASTVRGLEHRGFVVRQVEATVPVMVSYDLNPFGRS